MPRSSAASKFKVAIVYPASTSRIERASNELLEVRTKLRQLTDQKDELSGRLLKMVKHAGEPDDKGKVRYETTAHRYQVIPGRNVYIDDGKLRVAMVSAGLTPKQVTAILDDSGARQVTEYEYVGVYEQKAVAP